MSGQRGKEQELRDALSRAVSTFGFSQDISVPWGTADAAFWFSRLRNDKTEAIACRLRWSPEAVLLVDCVVSDHTLDVLARRGLENNAAGLNLFNYQVIFLEREPADLLPQNISLVPTQGRTWTEFVGNLAERIVFELDSAATIWNELRR